MQRGEKEKAKTSENSKSPSLPWQILVNRTHQHHHPLLLNKSIHVNFFFFEKNERTRCVKILRFFKNKSKCTYLTHSILWGCTISNLQTWKKHQLDGEWGENDKSLSTQLGVLTLQWLHFILSGCIYTISDISTSGSLCFLKAPKQSATLTEVLQTRIFKSSHLAEYLAINVILYKRVTTVSSCWWYQLLLLQFLLFLFSVNLWSSEFL